MQGRRRTSYNSRARAATVLRSKRHSRGSQRIFTFPRGKCTSRQPWITKSREVAPSTTAPPPITTTSLRSRSSGTLISSRPTTTSSATQRERTARRMQRGTPSHTRAQESREGRDFIGRWRESTRPVRKAGRRTPGRLARHLHLEHKSRKIPTMLNNEAMDHEATTFIRLLAQ